MKNWDNIIRDLCFQLKEFIGNKKAIIGLSGGIDSSVVAYLCANAVGKENIIGLVLPYGNQSVEDGRMVAKQLGIRCDEKNIKPIIDVFPILTYDSNVCRHDVGDKLVKGNIMARVRMVLLYQYANYYNGFVIGTTNKTESLIGYFTKYGDGAVDVEPIADLYKTDVWEIAKVLGVPQNIIDKTPSAELWEGQTDEEELGIDYRVLDKILQKDTTVNEFVFGNQELIGYCNKVKELKKNSEHKRYMPPHFKIKEEDD